MGKIGKFAFVAAPICLFACFLCRAMWEDSPLSAAFIVAATVFLAVALVAKTREKGTEQNKEEET
jgi:hypothetical protein